MSDRFSTCQPSDALATGIVRPDMTFCLLYLKYVLYVLRCNRVNHRCPALMVNRIQVIFFLRG